MLTDASGSLSSQPIHITSASIITKKRRKSYVEEEDIEVKPSTELIPDEYEHISNNAVLLHIFTVAENEDLAEDVLETMSKINYEVTKTNLHDLDDQTTFFKDLSSIKSQLIDKSALILIFIGFFKKDGHLFMVDDKSQECDIHIKDIWNMFSANNCPELKDKPKVFFFCTSKPQESRIQADAVGHQTMQFDKVYDFPAESDILIVYLKTKDTSRYVKDAFISQLCRNIELYSKKYDIIDLVSHMQKYVPLVISTLTRKFYLTPSSEREHYLSIVENSDILEIRLRKIKESVERLQLLQKKKKEKKFLSFPSFKRKSEDKPKIVPKAEKTKSEKSKNEKAKIVKPVETPRFSGSSPTPVGHRSRKQSETDNNERKMNTSSKQKPLWKP